MKRIYRFIRDSYFYFFAYSILGWFFEESLFLILKGKLVNRGYLYGPYLPVYGIGGLAFMFILNKFKKKKIKVCNKNITPVLVFASIFFLSTGIEYASHLMLDKIFNIKLWNYKKNKFNINGRVCLSSSLGFAAAGTLAIYFIQPLLAKKLHSLSNEEKNKTFAITSGTMLTDFLIKILSK